MLRCYSLKFPASHHNNSAHDFCVLCVHTAADDEAVSISHPCTPNHVLVQVSFTNNIPLLPGCGVVSGDTFDGAYSSAPSLTLQGLSGIKAGSAISTTTSSDSVLNGLTPAYANGNLEITPSNALSAGSYSFQFDVRNQESANDPSASALGLQASYVTMSGGTATAVSTPVDDTRPFKIVAPYIDASSRVYQSSDEPCADNTISVSLTTNVPLYLECSPKITLTGLTSSSSDTTVTELDLIFDSVSRSVTMESWTRTTGILVIVPGVDVDSSSNQFQVIFTLINPSHHQNAPGMDVDISYSGSSAWSTSALFTIFNGVTGIAGSSNSEEYYPMKIREAVISASIIQSSPFPCDQNTITVSMSADVTLRSRCNPTITLSGLDGSETGDGDISVTLSDGSTSSTQTESWASGALTIADTTGLGDLQAGTQHSLSFVITNPNAARASASTSLVVSLQDDFHSASTHAVSSMGLYAASALAGATWNARMGTSCTPQVIQSQYAHDLSC